MPTPPPKINKLRLFSFLYTFIMPHTVKKIDIFKEKNSAYDRNDNFGCLTSFFP